MEEQMVSRPHIARTMFRAAALSAVLAAPATAQD
jgi:hypothetical protein